MVRVSRSEGVGAQGEGSPAFFFSAVSRCSRATFSSSSLARSAVRACASVCVCVRVSLCVRVPVRVATVCACACVRVLSSRARLQQLRPRKVRLQNAD